MPPRYPADLIIRAVNARSNPYARLSDDPLPWVVITHDMIVEAQTGRRQAPDSPTP